MTKGEAMNIAGRTYSGYANASIRHTLEQLLTERDAPEKYQSTMTLIGRYLGDALNTVLEKNTKCLVASTAEDADYLSTGVINSLSPTHDMKAAIFWNNHYQIESGSVAPIVHKFIQPGYESSNALIIVKSVISGSCVVRTNILALIEKLHVDKIYIVSPVMHVNSKFALCSEFPDAISSKFEFVYFAEDQKKETSTGEVIPGIGGQIYDLLGIGEQPVRIGYIPNLVKRLVGA